MSINSLFQATVYVEDLEDQIELKLNLSDQETIQQIKEKFSTEYKIPNKNQVWIIDGEIPKDNKKVCNLNHHQIFHLVIIDYFTQFNENDDVGPNTTLKTNDLGSREQFQCSKCKFLNGIFIYH